MIGVVVDQRVFKYLLDLKNPKIAMHFEKLQLDPDPLICRWFLTLFAASLSLEVRLLSMCPLNVDNE
jgi:hypothetical protein